jgi:hypothetical protein
MHWCTNDYRVASIAEGLRDERDEGPRGVRTIVLAAGSEPLCGGREERHAYAWKGEPGHYVFTSSHLPGERDHAELFGSHAEALERFRSLTDGEARNQAWGRAA